MIKSKKLLGLLGAILAVAVAMYASTIPFWTLRRPPVIPADSPLWKLPFSSWIIAKPMMDLSYFVFKLIQWQTPPAMILSDLMTGYWKTEVLYGLVYHGILDELSPPDNQKTCAQVAETLALEEFMVCHYMDAGFHLGILHQTYNGSNGNRNRNRNRVFSLTAAGTLATSSMPYNFRDFVLASHGVTGTAWRGASSKSIQTGQSGVQAALGMDLWQYYELHPDERHLFDRLWHSAGYYQMGAALASWVPPREDSLFCDIGGGTGTATALFLEHYPDATAIVMDQPSVIPRTREYLSSRGLLKDSSNDNNNNNNNRAQTVAGNIFEPLPSVLQQCNVFFLKWVLHDWPDEENIQILKHIKNVATPGAKLVLMEVVPGTTNSPYMETIKSLQTINMIAMCKMGARERTWDEHKLLLTLAGFQNQPRLIPTLDIMSVIEIDV